jgi:predicted aspartyl protease
MLRYALVIVLASAFGAQAHEVCAPKPALVIAAEPSENALIILPARLGAQQTRLLLDTGSNWSLIKAKLVRTLGLKPKALAPRHYVDVAGGRIHHFVTIPNLALGSLILSIDFVVLPDTAEEALWEATLGAAALSRFDVEIDGLVSTVRLYRPDAACRGTFGPVTDNKWVEIPFTFDEQIPEFTATLDGKQVRAVFDTGASRSLMDLGLAGRLYGITPSSPGVSPRGRQTLPSGKTLPFYAYRFKHLGIGGLMFNDVEILLAELDVVPFTLGMSEIRHLHLYIAFERRRIYAQWANER